MKKSPAIFLLYFVAILCSLCMAQAFAQDQAVTDSGSLDGVSIPVSDISDLGSGGGANDHPESEVNHYSVNGSKCQPTDRRSAHLLITSPRGVKNKHKRKDIGVVCSVSQSDRINPDGSADIDDRSVRVTVSLNLAKKAKHSFVCYLASKGLSSDLSVWSSFSIDQPGSYQAILTVDKISSLTTYSMRCNIPGKSILHGYTVEEAV